MTLPFTGEYRDGDMVQCQRCAKNVRVKYYDRDTVVVVSTQEQQTLALRCQYCGYVLCDSCAHPADSLFPSCPSCQREWGPYYFTHDAIMPSTSKVAPSVTEPFVADTQPEVQKPIPDPQPATIETLGAGEADLYGEYRGWERKRGLRKYILIGVVFLLFVLLLFLALGPGKPVIRKGLNLLSARATRSPTNVFIIKNTLTSTGALSVSKGTQSLPKATYTPVKPGITSTALIDVIPTQKTTATTTLIRTSTPTSIPTATSTLEFTPTVPVLEENGCTPALSVTLDDVGKTLCVTGMVVFTTQNDTAFSIYFSNDDGYFRIVIYDRIPTDIKKDVCIRVTGEVKMLTGIPVMALGYHDVIVFCTP